MASPLSTARAQELLEALISEHPDWSSARVAAQLSVDLGVPLSKDAVQKRLRAMRTVDATRVALRSDVLQTSLGLADEVEKQSDALPAHGYVPSGVTITSVEQTKDGNPRKVQVSYKAPRFAIDRAPVPQLDYLKSLAPVPTEGAERYLCVSDTQMPFLNEDAWQLTLSWVRDVKPTRVYLLGDILDAYSISRFDHDPRIMGLADELAYTTARLAELRAAAGPDAALHLVAGNHEQRMQTFIMRQAPQLLGVKKNGVNVLTLPYLLSLDELGIEYHGEKPGQMGGDYLNGVVEIIPGPKRLVGTHGFYSRKNASSILPLVEAWDCSVIGGHDHKQNVFQVTKGGLLGAPTRVLKAISCGYNSMRDLGYTPTASPSWQPGSAVISRFGSDWTVDFLEIDVDSKTATWRDRRWELPAAAALTAAMKAVR